MVQSTVRESALKPTVTPTAVSESVVSLPQLLWRDSVIITPLTRLLGHFFHATRLVTWDTAAVESSFTHQDAGSRSLFALWIPETDWLASIANYESKHGRGQGAMFASYHDKWIHCDVRLASPTMLDPTGAKYRPIATLAVDFDNLTYDLHRDFGGDEALMKASCACRETQVGYVCMLMVLPQFQGRGYARDLMSFAEEWALRRGWTCEDAALVEGAASGVQQWIQRGESAQQGLPTRRLPPCRVIALATEATNKKNNQFYQRRGYTGTHIAAQEGWMAQFYVKDL